MNDMYRLVRFRFGSIYFSRIWGYLLQVELSRTRLTYIADEMRTGGKHDIVSLDLIMTARPFFPGSIGG